MYKAPPVSFDKVKEIFMPIFRKYFERKSNAVIAIEADTEKEADERFNEWCKDSDNYEELNCILNEGERDYETWLCRFGTWDEMNRSKTRCADIQINKKPKEPLFDLIIKYPTTDDYEEKWEGIKMMNVSHILGTKSVGYILEPDFYTTGATLKNLVDRREAGISAIMVFKATRREDK